MDPHLTRNSSCSCIRTGSQERDQDEFPLLPRAELIFMAILKIMAQGNQQAGKSCWLQLHRKQWGGKTRFAKWKRKNLVGMLFLFFLLYKKSSFLGCFTNNEAIRNLCMAGEGSCSSGGVEINEWWALSQDLGYPYLAQPIPRAAQTWGYSFPSPGQTFKLALLIAINVTNRGIRITFLPLSFQPVFAFPLSTSDATEHPCSHLTSGLVFWSYLL